MYQDFSVNTVIASLQEKCVYINFSMDVDPSTINDTTVEIYDRQTRNTLKYASEVNGREVKITLDVWPTPNIDYIIVVQQAKDVLGNDLSSGVRRRLVFKSDIASNLTITYPSDTEVITDLVIRWIEWDEEPQKPSVNPVGFYRIQISKEKPFYSTVKDVPILADIVFNSEGQETSKTIKTELDISDLVDGQYYIRGRVEKDGLYGMWSSIVTFVIGDEIEPPGPIIQPPNVDPIFDGGIQILNSPRQGETPGSFVIEFDKAIDPQSLTNIVIVRRLI